MKQSIATPYGELFFVGKCSNIELKAELRGLELLMRVVQSSTVWEIDYSHSTPVVCSTDPGPQISIDVFQCIIGKLVENNAHLNVYMDLRRVCVLKKPSAVNTPITDSIVSLVLLGNAGWPLESTPGTMTEKSIEIEESGIYSEMKIHLRVEDRIEMKRISDSLVLLNYHDALVSIGRLSRRWYVCKGWSLATILQFTEPLRNQINDTLLSTYLRQPNEPTDVLFLKQSGMSAHECSSAVATDSQPVSV